MSDRRYTDSMIRYQTCLIALLLLVPFSALSQEQEEPRSVADVAASVRDSIVVVTTEDPQGEQAGLGTGFVIDPRGLIATSLHVISQARPIWVQLRNGKRYPVTEVRASDRNFDLAILEIQPDTPLEPLRLGRDQLDVGQVTVAIGHPQGLQHSVVSGVVAGKRTLDGMSMWQIAMPIEPGNSGGPLLDRQGRVQGIIAMKSVGESFGFAVQVGLLRKLIDTPNPTAIEHWPTSIRLNEKYWSPRMGARWSQRGGSILVDSTGNGFGGRSILLRVDETPEPPFEVAVSVKLADESGAAGLVFLSDGKDKHYGFYPSNGNLRLTNFNGPSVFTWDVLREIQSPSYQQGEWNEIRVRVEKDKISAFVNDELVTSVDQVQQPNGLIGLCKFRDTRAEFKDFRFGKSLTSHVVNAAKLDQAIQAANSLPTRQEVSDVQLDTLLTDDLTQQALEQKAKSLEAQATELRQLAADLHTATICKALREIAQKPDAEIDVLEGALWISKLDNPGIDVNAYLQLMDDLASQAKATFPPDATEAQRRDALNAFLFRKSGYYGSRLEYYDIRNSHIDRVIDDREGIPITLSVFYMALAKRLDIQVVGVGLPGHFMVRHEPPNGEPQLVDVFHGGKLITREEAKIMAIRTSGKPATEDSFAASTSLEILRRILTNMRAIAQGMRDTEALLRYVEALSAITPDDTSYRGLRGVLRFQLGRKTAARDDFDWLLENAEQVDPLQLRQIRLIRAQMD